jgi:Tfp pilus assembly protein PilF
MRIPSASVFLMSLVLAAFPYAPGPIAKNDSATQLDFGVQAARKGLWREALFRWERARKAAPEDSRVLNNLAVAYETTGDFRKADELYRTALRLDPGNRDIRQNYDLFSGFYKELQSRSAPASEVKPPDAPRQEPADDSSPR